MDNAGLPETRTWQVETRHGDAGRCAGMEHGGPRFDQPNTLEPCFLSKIQLAHSYMLGVDHYGC
jgi:hypothetical protein